MTAIILQARLDSKRLPQKALLPLDGKPLIMRVMLALNRIPADLRILACSEDSFSSFLPIVKETNFEIFKGPKDDVLARFCNAIKFYGITRVIRATGDNPFVFTDAAIAINAEALALNADYACYQGIPTGTGIESVNAAALLQAEKESSSPYDREHVCPYLYTHFEQFKIHRPLAPLRWQGQDLRMTIDTQDDYERAKILYAELNKFGDKRYLGNTIIALSRKLQENNL